jgi:hypothetical protein
MARLLAQSLLNLNAFSLPLLVTKSSSAGQTTVVKSLLLSLASDVEQARDLAALGQPPNYLFLNGSPS